MVSEFPKRLHRKQVLSKPIEDVGRCRSRKFEKWRGTPLPYLCHNVVKRKILKETKKQTKF